MTIAAGKIEAFGLDALVDMIYDGHSMTAIAAKIGVSKSSLSEWCARSEHSARVCHARVDSAELWDRKAEEELRSATCPDEIAVARELAHHYRWRASKIAPRSYGDNSKIEHAGVVTLAEIVGGTVKKPE